MTQLNYRSMICQNVLTKMREKYPVGIENRKTNNFTTNSIERIESYASLKKKARMYKKYNMILLMMCVFISLLALFAYNEVIKLRDAYIMHNYTYHYEGRHTTAPPLTWNTWSNVKEGEK